MKERRVTPIKDGTVIDHILPGMAVNVIRIIGLERITDHTVSVLINARSQAKVAKDMVKFEGLIVKPVDVDKIAMVSPGATISIIRDFEVIKKYTVHLPEEVKGIVQCSNPNCISNQKEPVESEFTLLSKEPLKLRCIYCEREMGDIPDHLK